MRNKILFTLALILAAGLTSYAQEISLSLNDCKAMAEENKSGIKNSYLDVLAAQAQKKEVNREILPRVSFNAFGIMSANPFVQYIIDKEYVDILKDWDAGISQMGYNVGFSLIQPIYVGGQIATGKKLAQLGVNAADLKHKINVRSSMEEIEKYYWEIVALEEKKNTLAHLDSLLNVLEKDVTSGIQAGVLTSTEMMMVQMKKNELKSGKLELEGGLNLLKMNLFNNIGQEYCLVKDVADSTKPYIGNISLSDRLDDILPPDQYYMDENEMAAGVDEANLLEMLVESKKLEKRIAKGQVLPSVALGVAGGYSRFQNSSCSTNAAMVAVVRVPITQWAKSSQKLKRMDYEIQKAQNDKDFLESQLLLQIRQLWYNLNIAWEKVQIAKDNLNLAEKTVKSQIDEFNAGLIPLKDLMMTQTSLYEASEGYINSQIEYSKALTAYLGRR